jgi:hypothetical protein
MFKNAFTPIVGATARLISIRVKPVQLWNAPLPIEVIELPMLKVPVKVVRA